MSLNVAFGLPALKEPMKLLAVMLVELRQSRHTHGTDIETGIGDGFLDDGHVRAIAEFGPHPLEWLELVDDRPGGGKIAFFKRSVDRKRELRRDIDEAGREAAGAG